MDAEWFFVADDQVDVHGSISTGSVNTLTTLNISHTITARANLCLYVGVIVDSNTAQTTTCSWNGTPMTLVGQVNASATSQQVDVYRLVNPATGTHNVSITSSSSFPIVGIAVTLANVNQTTPESGVQTDSGSGTDLSVSVSGDQYDMILDFVGVNSNPTITPGSGQVSLANLNVDGSAGTMAGSSRQLGDTSVVMDWTWTGTQRSAQVALCVNVVAVAGGTTFFRNFVESLAGSDTSGFQRLANANRSLSESLGGSETYSRLSNASRMYADNLAESDAFRRIANGLRAFVDVIGDADAFQRIANGLRQPIDNLGMSDAYQRLANALRRPIDNLGGTEAYQRQSTANRTYTDNLGLAEAYRRISDASRAFVDNLGMSDAAQRISNAQRSQSDTIGFSDAYQRISNAMRLFVDNLGLADAATLQKIAAGVLTLQVVELFGMAENYQRTATGNRSFVDNLGVAESLSRIANAARSVSDTLGILEVLARVATANRNIADQLGAAEAYRRIANSLRGIADNLGASDTTSLLKWGVLLLAVADNLGGQDVFQRQATFHRVFSDTLGMGDLATLVAVTTAIISALELTGSYQRVLQLLASYAQEIMVTASYSGTLTLTGAFGMAVTTPGKSMYIAEDKILNGTVYQVDDDGVITSTVQDISGWSLRAILHKYDDPSTVYVTKTTGLGIVIVSGIGGTFAITLDGEDTEDLSSNTYQLAVSRTDTGQDTVLLKIPFTLNKR